MICTQYLRICSNNLTRRHSAHRNVSHTSACYLVPIAKRAFGARRSLIETNVYAKYKVQYKCMLWVDLNISYSHHIEVNEFEYVLLALINEKFVCFMTGSSANHYGQHKTLPRQRDDDHELNSRQWCRPSGQQSCCWRRWGCRSVGQNAGADQSTTDAEHICGPEQWQRFAVRSTIHDDGAQSHRKRVEHFERVFFAGRKSSE